ncbi:MAG: hypothetical protein AMXMBFR55_30990 [Gemmatimonadota bacterium]
MWNLMDDLRIEKARLPVVLITLDGERISGELFVQASARNGSGHETAHDVLNGAEPFFPIATMKGLTLLVAKEQVRELFVAREDADEDEWDFGTPAEVEVVMQGGAAHVGTILVHQVTGRRRVLDYLNRFTERFVALYKEEGVVLLNRARIAHVRQDS